jgi:hypothetical protein
MFNWRVGARFIVLANGEDGRNELRPYDAKTTRPDQMLVALGGWPGLPGR